MDESERKMSSDEEFYYTEEDTDLASEVLVQSVGEDYLEGITSDPPSSDVPRIDDTDFLYALPRDTNEALPEELSKDDDDKLPPAEEARPSESTNHEFFEFKKEPIESAREDEEEFLPYDVIAQEINRISSPVDIKQLSPGSDNTDTISESFTVSSETSTLEGGSEEGDDYSQRDESWPEEADTDTAATSYPSHPSFGFNLPAQEDSQGSDIGSTAGDLEKRLGEDLEEQAKILESVEPIVSREPFYRRDTKQQEYAKIGPYVNKYSLLMDPQSNHFNSLHVQDYRQYDSTSEGMIKAFLDTVSFVKNYTNADEGHLYITEDDEIYRYNRSECSSNPTKWPIGSGTIIAAHVAHCNQCVILHRGLFGDKRFPLGTGKSGPELNSVICVPVISPDRKVLAVMEFGKSMPNSNFTKDQLNYVIAMGAWMAAAITRKATKSDLIPYREFNGSLLKCFSCYLRGKLSVHQFVSTMMNRLREYVDAEIVAYYSIIAGTKAEAQVFEMHPTKKDKLLLHRKQSERLWADEILKKVVETNDFISYGRKELEMFEAPYSGYQSVLCVPVGAPRRILGIVKLVNKIDKYKFSVEDKSSAVTCGRYCSSALFYAAIGQQFKKNIEVVQNQKEVLIFHMAPCSHSVQQFRSRVIVKPPPYYLSFQWYPSDEELAQNVLADYVWWMFKDLFEGDPFLDKFDYFLLMVKKGYQDQPYHNFEHAFCATHCMFVIIRKCSQKFTFLEQLSLMVGMLCHDVDHPGNTNNYVRQSGNAMSELYRDSFLENHHSNVTKIIINHTEIFAHLKPGEFRKVCDDIHRLIMSTDLKYYFRKRGVVSELLKQNAFQENIPEHKMLMKYLIMTTCDLSGQCKPLKVTRRLTLNLYRELYREGDNVRKLGYTPLSAMDRRNYLEIPGDQVHFLTEVVIPCTTVMCQLLPELKELYSLCSAVCDAWKIERFRGASLF